MVDYDYRILELANVQQALKALRLATPLDTQSALLRLQLVENMLADVTYPGDRVYALNLILSEHITHGYSQNRSTLGLPLPGSDETLADARHTIAQDGRTGNPELIGWSWLYYAYVRVELHLSAAQFCEVAHIDPRTLRRYQKRAMLRLTARLIAGEQQARQS